MKKSVVRRIVLLLLLSGVVVNSTFAMKVSSNYLPQYVQDNKLNMVKNLLNSNDMSLEILDAKTVQNETSLEIAIRMKYKNNSCSFYFILYFLIYMHKIDI